MDTPIKPDNCVVYASRNMDLALTIRTTSRKWCPKWRTARIHQYSQRHCNYSYLHANVQEEEVKGDKGWLDSGHCHYKKIHTKSCRPPKQRLLVFSIQQSTETALSCICLNTSGGCTLWFLRLAQRRCGSPLPFSR